MKDGRTTTGRPISRRTASASSSERAVPERGTSAPISSIACLKSSRSSASRTDCSLAPISRTLHLSRTPRSASASARLRAVWPADRREDRVRPLLLDDPLEELGRQGLDVRRVGELRVGHDRGRVRVDEDDPVTLALERADGLRARVVELAGLSDDDRARPDDEDACGCRCAGAFPGARFELERLREGTARSSAGLPTAQPRFTMRVARLPDAGRSAVRARGRTPGGVAAAGQDRCRLRRTRRRWPPDEKTPSRSFARPRIDAGYQAAPSALSTRAPLSPTATSARAGPGDARRAAPRRPPSRSVQARPSALVNTDPRVADGDEDGSRSKRRTRSCPPTGSTPARPVNGVGLVKISRASSPPTAT